MNKYFSLLLFFILIFVTSCSFDSKTGIWDGQKDEKKRIYALEQEQANTIRRTKIYTSQKVFSTEIPLESKVLLSKPSNNVKWQMPGLNYQNLLGNIYLPSIKNNFLKKKIGKSKSLLINITPPPLFYEGNIYIADDTGTIYKISENGKLIWKKNIYKKIHKKIYKRISLTIYENNIYVSDNVGFIYSVNLKSGELIWIKNHGIPLKSKIKVYKGKIFLINQDNRILALSSKDGSLVWDLRSITSFIKSKSLLSLAISTDGYIVASSSAGELIKLSSINGQVLWALNSLSSISLSEADFFASSDIVLFKNNVLFSTQSSIVSYDLKSGLINWEKEINSLEIPIVDRNNIFFVTSNGFFVILKADTGKLIFSSNILINLKKKNQKTKITGFIIGSGKIYAVTANGYLIVVSASSGVFEHTQKIGDRIFGSPIISNGKLFILTEKSRIFGFN